MNIVQLANFHGPRSGGLRVAVDTLRAGYESAGQTCVLIAPGSEDAAAPGLRTVRSPKLPNKSGYRMILRRKAVLSLLEDLRPDVLEVHDKLLAQWVYPWSREQGVPVLAMSHERLGSSLPLLFPFLPDGVIRTASIAVARKSLQACDRLVVCSRFAAAEFAGLEGSDRVRVVPLGVDLTTFRPGPAGGPDVGPIRLVLASRLSLEKRPDLAVAAVHELVRAGVDVHLDVLGDGPLHDDLADVAYTLPVRFHGFVRSRSALGAALAGADVALVPGPVETFGLAALEALACGTPVIAIDGSGSGEFVRTASAAGAAVAPSASAVAGAILELTRYSREERRAAAREVAERYPWSATVDSMLALHRELHTHRRVSAA